MFLSEDFKKEILLKPLEAGADELLIVSGYATPNMASWLLKELDEGNVNNIKIKLIIGMALRDGISITAHEGFKKLVTLSENSNQFQCSYVYTTKAVHTKLYVWLKQGVPLIAFNGSANFTQTAFNNVQREVMSECDSEKAKKYFEGLIGDTIHCNHNEVEEYIVLRPANPSLDMDNKPVEELSSTGIEKVVLSLLDSRTGEMPARSGLNWGQRDGREKNQAYISCPSKVARSGFFPLKGQHFTVITDDGHLLILRLEQEGDKALTTPQNNSLLGEYFRNRLGLANGAYVNTYDVKRYGRTDVTFYKLDEEQFYMDFTVPDEG